MITTIPSALAMVRVQLGITQQQLADTLGLSRALIAMAERGSRRLPDRARDYLNKLREIAQQHPQLVGVPLKKRRSVASIRPAYNRISFSSRRCQAAGAPIATVIPSKSILSAEEVREAGKKLKDRFLHTGKQPGSADACRELLKVLQLKSELASQRLQTLELELAAAPGRATELKGQLTLLNARLKAARYCSKNFPLQRKKWRLEIAGLYVKKLRLQDLLEKFKRPVRMKRKMEIAALKKQLKEQGALAKHLENRVSMLEMAG